MLAFCYLINKINYVSNSFELSQYTKGKTLRKED